MRKGMEAERWLALGVTVAPELERDEGGVWGFAPASAEDLAKVQPAYREALPRYLTALDPGFTRARATSEFEFLLSLFRVSGSQDADWDPYETTIDGLERLVAVHAHQRELYTQRHLQLWVYEHIVEASTPSEILANLIDVAQGGRFSAVTRFPRSGGRRPSPWAKLNVLKGSAGPVGLTSITIPLDEIWDRHLRNAIAHAEYALHGSSVRIVEPVREYSGIEIDTLVNRALAYHAALSTLWTSHIGSYRVPVKIPVHPGFGGDPGEHATVIVREGYGAIGLKTGGTMPFMIGHFYMDEIESLKRDPNTCLLPPRRIDPHPESG